MISIKNRETILQDLYDFAFNWSFLSLDFGAKYNPHMLLDGFHEIHPKHLKRSQKHLLGHTVQTYTEILQNYHFSEQNLKLMHECYMQNCLYASPCPDSCTHCTPQTTTQTQPETQCKSRQTTDPHKCTKMINPVGFDWKEPIQIINRILDFSDHLNPKRHGWSENSRAPVNLRLDKFFAGISLALYHRAARPRLSSEPHQAASHDCALQPCQRSCQPSFSVKHHMCTQTHINTHTHTDWNREQ